MDMLAHRNIYTMHIRIPSSNAGRTIKTKVPREIQKVSIKRQKVFPPFIDNNNPRPLG